MDTRDTSRATSRESSQARASARSRSRDREKNENGGKDASAQEVVDVALDDPLDDKISKAVARAFSIHLPKAMEAAVETALPDVVKKHFGPMLEGIAKDQKTQKENHTQLSQRTDKLEEQIKSTQTTLGKHLKDLETMAHNVQYIYDVEQAAAAPFKHMSRVQGWAPATAPDKRFQSLKDWLTSKMPDVAAGAPYMAHKQQAVVISFKDAATAAKFAREFIADKPTVDGKPIYCKPELPPMVIESQRPLVNVRHALKSAKKGEEVKVCFKTRRIFLKDTCVARQMATKAMQFDHKNLGAELAKKLEEAAVATNYFQNLKKQDDSRDAPPAKVLRTDGKGSGKGKSGQR